LIEILYTTGEACAGFAAVEALGYFDRRIVTQSLFDALIHRGPRERMIEYLVTELDAAPNRVRPLLVRALRSPDASARAAAVEGLYLSDVGRGSVDPTLFPAFARLLHDPSPDVRRYASVVVGMYGGQLALDALRSAVTDLDGDVSAQATIAVGWVAMDAAVGSQTRRQALELLTTLADSGRPGVSSQAVEWLNMVRPR
jgi:HEAT repeat protein